MEITRMFLQNFRSIVNGDLELRKINILSGANNSGKSSLIYGLLALKNLVMNSNQSLDSCLTLGFINLGGFDQTVHFKNQDLSILLGIDVASERIESSYSVVLGKRESELRIKTSKPFKIEMQLPISLPYPANKNTGFRQKSVSTKNS